MSLGLAIALAVAAVAVTAAVLVRVYVLPLRRLAREASLIASANPAYRTDTWRLPPLRGLAVADQRARRALQGARRTSRGRSPPRGPSSSRSETGWRR